MEAGHRHMARLDISEYQGGAVNNKATPQQESPHPGSLRVRGDQVTEIGQGAAGVQAHRNLKKQNVYHRNPFVFSLRVPQGDGGYDVILTQVYTPRLPVLRQTMENPFHGGI